jgi:hypothetical protein
MAQMTDDEVRGRLVVLEVFCMSAIGIIFALTAKTDPTNEMAISTLNGIQDGVKRRLAEAADPAIVQPGEAYLDELLSEVSENLGMLRPNRK